MHGSQQLFRAALEHHLNPYVLGLDFSLTSTGVYFLSLNPDEDHPDFHYHVPTTRKTGTDPQRIDHIVDTILCDATIAQYPVIAACIEDYGPTGKTAGKVTVRAEINGCVKRGLREAGIPYYLVSPNGLKKFATGNGGADKNKARMFAAASALDFDTKISDEVDAFHAARLMAAIVRGERLDLNVVRVNPIGYEFA